MRSIPVENIADIVSFITLAAGVVLAVGNLVFVRVIAARNPIPKA
jgi:hypothetical protein